MKKSIVIKIISLFFVSCQICAMEDATPLHSAVRKGDRALVKALLEQYETDVNKRDNFGFTSLHVALIRGKLVDTHSISYTFDWAKSKNPEEDRAIVRLLIAFGAQTTLKVCTGYANFDPTQITFVQDVLAECRQIKLHSASLLLDLHKAAIYGKANLVAELLQYHHFDIDINKKDASGYTPLHYAVKYGRLAIVQLLLNEPTTKIDEKTNNGLTALHLALIGCDQGVELKSQGFCTDLWNACNEGVRGDCKDFITIVHLLILHRADETLVFHGPARDIIPLKAKAVREAIVERNKELFWALCATFHPQLGVSSPLRCLDQSTIRNIIWFLA